MYIDVCVILYVYVCLIYIKIYKNSFLCISPTTVMGLYILETPVDKFLSSLLHNLPGHQPPIIFCCRDPGSLSLHARVSI